MTRSAHEFSRDEAIAIPLELADRSVERLKLPAGIRAGLTLAGIRRMGDLNGLRPQDLEPLIGMGPHGAVDVSRAVERFINVLARCPVAGLYEASAVHAVLRGRGFANVSDLIGMTADALAARTGIVRTRAEAIQNAVRRLTAIPPARLSQVVVEREDDSISLPAVDSGIIAALALADTLEEEIYALAIQPRPVDALLLLRWWGLIEGPAPSLHQLSSERGLTGERIRQIIMPHEHRLRLGEVRPPIAIRVAALLLRHGPEMTPCRLVQACAEQSIVVEVNVLRALPALARMGLIGNVRIELRNDVLTAMRL